MASLSGTGSVSSSNSLGNTSLRGFGGMVSGIDRDSIIEQMTLGTTTKINNVKNDITKLQWKQEAYRSLSDQILNITDKYTSFSSSTSLLDPMTFAKSIISVEGSDKSTKYVKASGTSDMINTIALEGVEKLASSAVQQSEIKQSSNGLMTGLDDLEKDISVSRLNNGVDGRTLTFGMYSSIGGWSGQTTFTFPAQYQARGENNELLYDENGNKVMKNIDYTSEDYEKIAEQLNYALQDSSASININGKSTKLSECFEFKCVKEEAKDEEGNTILGDDGKPVMVARMQISTDGKKGLGNYKINSSASSALSSLGYSGDGGAIDVDQYNKNLGSFADSSVTRMSVLDSLTGAKVNFTYNGSTKEIVLVTADDKEEILKVKLTEEELKKIKEEQDKLTRVDLTDEERAAVEKSVLEKMLSEKGISLESITSDVIKDQFGGNYDTEVNNRKDKYNNYSEEQFKEEFGISKDSVANADANLSINVLAEKYNIKREQFVVGEGGDDLPDVTRIDPKDYQDENGKWLDGKYEQFVKDVETAFSDYVKGEYKKDTGNDYDAELEAAYQTARTEAIEAKVKQEIADAASTKRAEAALKDGSLTEDQLDKYAADAGITKEAIKKRLEQNEGESDEDYNKRVDAEYRKEALIAAGDQLIMADAAKIYKEEVDKVKADPNYTTNLNTAIKDAEAEALARAKQKIEDDALHGKQLEKMAELLQPRLDKAFGVGKDGPNVEAVVKDGKLAFEAASDNTSLSITTGSSGGSVLGNMGIISGATNKVNLNGDLKQDSLGIDPEKLDELLEEGLVINGTKIEGITKNSTINDILNKINKSDAGVKATYVQSSGQFMLVSEETGAGRQIKLDSELAQKLFGQNDASGAYEAGKGFKEGEDAIIHVNYGNGMSVVVQNSSNTFNLEGLNVTVTGEFGGTKDANGVWQADSSERVTFSSKADAEAVTEKVKNFFEDFNKLITESYNQLTTRSDSSYGPLSDEQKAEMSETSIENWETKAKQGILYNDSIVRDLNSTLESFLTQLMGSGISYQDLEKIGITYDESWSGGASTIVFNESKFRSAMENEPELVSDIFTGTGKSGGVGLVKTVEDMLTPYATRVASKNRGSGSDKGSYGRLIEEAGSEKVPTSTLNNFIYDQIKEMNQKIQTLQAQLKSQQERYIKQFTSMETLINQYNSQSGYLANLSG
ncbi:MAG: flagellar filament capping protein FliD [Lachnospiraceae bacterium]|nr:flagellar filament capping protein FliD [Lachnospiraceae bacterium]